jgi:hypothetical protein
MRVTRMSVLVTAVAVAFAGTASPVGAVNWVQRCTRPQPEARAGVTVFRPGLNARPTKQKITAGIDLFTCTPDGPTGGVGAFAATFKPPAAQKCALINTAHTLTGTAKITWKNGKTSALRVTFALSGASRIVSVKGKINAGAFAGHALTGEYRYTPFASHHGTTVTQACADKVAANQQNRNSVVKMELFRTKPFTIA